MDYSKIISVTGLGGLFELMASKADGAIVRSLEDKSTRFVSSRVHNFSHLESIEVYTERENVNLVDVFQAMEKSNEKLPDEKDPKAVTAYFRKTYPEMDFDRVYASDMKKMVRWFRLLKDNGVEIKLSEMEEEETEAAEQEQPPVQEEVKQPEEKPSKKKSPAKGKTSAAESATAEPIAEEPKKRGRKKKTEE